MRILHVNPSLNPADGGPPEATRTLTIALLEAGHEVEIATLDAPDSPWLNSFPCTVHGLGPGRFGKYRYSRAFKAWLKNNALRFDIVMVHGIFQYHAFAARAVLTDLRLPYVLFIHGALDPWFKRRYPLKHLKKWLYWPWGDYRVIRDAARVLYTTEDERVLARQSFWLYDATEAVVSLGTEDPPNDENGEQRSAFTVAFPALRQRRFLLFLSRLDEKKGCRLLIKSFASAAQRDPDLLLVMAGPDTSKLRAGLENLADELGVADRVIWTGMLSGSVKWGAYRTAEAFVLTSHSENFGIVVAEALACGAPVLISKRVNIWREVVAAGAGFAAEDDLDASTSMLGAWIDLSPQSRLEMSNQGRALFLKQFEVTSASRRVSEELAAVAGK